MSAAKNTLSTMSLPELRSEVTYLLQACDHFQDDYEQLHAILERTLTHWEHTITDREELRAAIKTEHARAHPYLPWPVCRQEICILAQHGGP